MLDLEELKQRLNYNPSNGEFRYKISVAQMRAGHLAGRPNTNGHIQISIKGKRYMAHTLAWFYVTGEWPVFVIDHENRIYDDNSWKNLRLSTLSQNQGNRKTWQNGTSKYKGIYWNKTKKKWIAQIGMNNKRIYLGQFNNELEAFEVYKKAALQYFGEFASW